MGRPVPYRVFLKSKIMKSEEAQELIKAIRLLTHEVQMLGHGNAVQTDPTRQFGAIEMLGMKITDTLEETSEMSRKDWFAAFALCGMIAHQNHEVSAQSAWAYAEQLIDGEIV
jgi:hypothetical protein